MINQYPNIAELCKAKTFWQMYDALLPSVKSILLPYKDYCVFSSGVIPNIRHDLCELKEYVMKYAVLSKEHIVDYAIQRCFETVNKEIDES